MFFIYRFLIHAVLNDSYSALTPLIDFFAVEISDKNRIPELLSLLPPLPLVYLKRIKGNLILFTNDLTQIDLELRQKVVEFTGKDEFVIVKVCFFIHIKGFVELCFEI